ncbi:MAG: dockerin type I repeat-containing protein [Candidatus Daviesbacteria bacterium]|nr:MAG: dockerin type I repeat-containing protein [Candidatus Daviesbacteria bacterium]
MFQTTKYKIILAVYVFLILSIPLGAYMASQQQNVSSKASDKKVTKQATNSANLSALDALKNLSQKVATSSSLDSDSGLTKIEESTSSSAISFGPTLNLKLILEGRPPNNQTAKVFVGIAEGSPVNSPKYLLSFTIDLPASGLFSGLSMAGLTTGTGYSAYIKGPAQIATSSAFTLNPSATDLNSGQALTLLSGDLNDDNSINSADFAIAKGLYGTTTTSNNWNDNVDLNKDGIINSADLAYIIKNLGTTGQSGVWQSTPTGGLSQGGPEASRSGGYWLWMPDL